MKTEETEKEEKQILKIEAKEEECVYLDFGDIFAN